MQDYALKIATYYYYGILNAEEQEVYRKVLHGLLIMDSKIMIESTISQEALQKVIQYILNDRPDIFWFRGACTTILHENIREALEPQYTYTKENVKKTIEDMKSSQFYKELDELLSSKRFDHEKAIVAYEYIIQHTEYEEAALKFDDEKLGYVYEMTGVILKGRAVCAGYAKTFQYFMNRHGIVCTFVTGNTERESHAWNILNFYGDWYYVDTTWGDPIFDNPKSKKDDYISYAYFCFTTEEMEKSHTAKLDAPMPLCTATKYNYYNYNKLIEDSYSVEGIARQIVRARRKKKKEVIIKYRSDADYHMAINCLKKGDLVRAKELADTVVHGKGTYDGNYCYNHKNLEIKFYI